MAARLGARVLPVASKGYGNALMGGIAAARGKFVLMGDADDSYDFLDVPRFVAKLREGFDLVQGCRLPSGGGTVKPGAMPFLHRWWGNPMFSMMARTMFGAPIHDVYCGMRAFTKTFYDRLDMRCTGMEFATEMIIKASLNKQKIAEIPITLYPDGRKAHAPHLKTFRDGWRTLRFFMVCSPRWSFLVPGFVALALGALGYGLALPGVKIGPATFDVHTLLVASLAILIGHQAVFLALASKTFAESHGLLPQDPRLLRFYKFATLERGLIAGLALFAVGVGLVAYATWAWSQKGFGPLNYPQTLRVVIPGCTLAALGFQTGFMSFFISVLGVTQK
jgi:hypothetical protein